MEGIVGVIFVDVVLVVDALVGVLIPTRCGTAVR
jgi:hypothetical protein